MRLKTYPMFVEALHTTGVNLVRCPALGTTDVYITDDFGGFVQRDLGQMASMQYSMGSGE
jgi:hypothetical protein